MHQNVERQVCLRRDRSAVRAKRVNVGGRVLGKLGQETADGESDGSTDGRACRKGRERDGANGRWGEGVREDTELDGTN